MSENTLKVRLIHPCKTDAEWASSNPVAKNGEIMISSDKSGMFKVGNGTSKWSELGYNHVTWENVEGKPSTFPPTVHKHTKSDITDFPSAMKNPNALTIKTNGTSQAVYDGGVAKEVNITASSIGLGNVNNTADKDKSVKYADNAGTANIASNVANAGVGSDNKARHVWFSNTNPETNRVYSDKFLYNPATDTLTVGNITGKAGSVDWANVNGKPSSYTPSSHTHTKSQITDFPTSMPASDVYAWAKAASKPSYSWNEITGKPSTFTPSSHSHANITSSGRKDPVVSGTTPNDPSTEVTLSGLSMSEFYGVGSNSPCPYGNVINVMGSSSAGAGELLLEWSGSDSTTGRLYYRSHRDTKTGGWGAWKTVAYTSDIPSTVAWDKVTGKPSTYPATAHTHDDRYYTETEINDKVTALNNRIATKVTEKTITTATDFNTFTTTGIYHICVSTNSNLHAPTTNHGTLIVDFSVGTPYQIWMPDNVVDAQYKRTYTKSSSTWSGWTTQKLTDTVYTHPSYTAYTSGLYKITTNSLGHVTSATAVTKGDITALGIPGSNTDSKVLQTAVKSSDYTNWRTVLWGASNSGTEGFAPTTVTDSVFSSQTLTFQPSTGTLKANTFKGNLSGNATSATSATTATKLATARTISLTGSVTGSGSFDGSGNLSITTSTNHTHSYSSLTGTPTIGNGTITIKQNGTQKATFTMNQTGNTTVELTDTNTNTWRGIQNNLTSDSTSDSLAAAQGKALKGMVDAVDKKVDGIEIGGRNLLRSTDIDKYGTGPWVKNGDASKIEVSSEVTYLGKKTIKITGDNGITVMDSKRVLIKTNTKYVYSIMMYPLADLPVSASNPASSRPMHVWTLNSDSNLHHETIHKFYPSVVPKNTWTRVYIVLSVKSNLLEYYHLCPFLYGIGDAGVYVCEPKVEEGTMPTPWTPAPEDIDDSISSLSSRITTNTNSISSLKTTVSNKLDTSTFENYKSHTHKSVIDSGNSSSATTFAYSKAGMNYGDYSWLAGWNGYELRAVNKNQFATSGHNHDSVYSKLGHGHAIADVSGLQGSLDGKLSSSGGTMTGCIHIKGTAGSYNENIRIHPSSSNWSSIIMCGDDNTGDSGTSAKTWGIFTYNGDFSIAKNGTKLNGASATAALTCIDNVWSVNGNTILNSSNYTSYTVTKTGSGASGTWSISISGNAATASKASSADSVTWGNVSGKPSSFTPSSHTHSYLPLSGGSLSGNISFSNNTGITALMAGGSDGWGIVGSGTDDAGRLKIYVSDNGTSDWIDFEFRDYMGTTYTPLQMTGNRIIANCTIEGSISGSAGSVAWMNVTGKPSTFTPASHSHNYAGSSSAGGSATSAVKLDTATAGSATQPVYFSGGKPVACTYTLGKSVPSNAVFTDTNTWRGIQNNLTSDSTSDSLSAAQGKVLKGLVDGKANTSHTHTKSQITDFPSSMPASDVYSWAKASSKPSYSWSEIGSKPSTFTPAAHTHSSIVETASTTAVPAKAADGTVEFYYNVNNGLTNNMPATDNANAIISLSRHSGDYPSQLGFSSNGNVYYRAGAGTTAWKTIIDSGNYTSYTVTKTGSGASGTWGINVTGSAGSVAWGNVSGRPSSLPASDVYAWAKASSKPSYSWGEITGKPSSFTPSSHTHNYLPLSGGTVTGNTTFNNGVTIKEAGVELYYTTPFIDFHYKNDSSVDYTSRIIELEKGKLNVNGTVCSNDGSLWCTSFSTDGGVNARLESTFSSGTYTDPLPGVSCGIKVSGMATATRFYVRGRSGTWLSSAQPGGAGFECVNDTIDSALIPGWRIRNLSGAWVGASYNMDKAFHLYYAKAERLSGNTDNGTDADFIFNGRTGNFSAKSITQTSDERRKSVISSSILDIYKDFFMKIKPFSFKWKDGQDDTATHLGVGAQSVFHTALECGFEESDIGLVQRGKEYPGTSIPWSVSYTEFIPLNIAVTQDHETRIEKLERENEELKQQIKELKGLTA